MNKDLLNEYIEHQRQLFKALHPNDTEEDNDLTTLLRSHLNREICGDFTTFLVYKQLGRLIDILEHINRYGLP